MKEIDLVPMVNSFLSQGLSVCYVDEDYERRLFVAHTPHSWAQLIVLKPDISNITLIHDNVLIMVNSHKFDPKVLKELKNVPGVSNGYNTIVINVTTE